MLVFPVVLAAVWCAIAFELVVESARIQGRALVLFGNLLAAPSVAVTIVVLCVVSASAALAMAIAVAHARGRRLERRMAVELDGRWAALAERDAGDAARQNLVSWRIAELQTLVEQLLAERRNSTRRGCSWCPNLRASATSDRVGARSSPSLIWEVSAWVHRMSAILMSSKGRRVSRRGRAHI